MNFDPYEALGVSKDAGQDDIKKAYRKLARKYHPDVNPGNAESEEKFKQVSEAYDILGDKEKRAEYDRLGQQQFYDQAFGGQGYQRPDAGAGFSFEDLFGDIFSQRGGGGGGVRFDFGGGGGGYDFGGGFGQGYQTGPRKGESLNYRMKIGFRDAIFGTETTFDLEHPATCSACGGQGIDLSSTSVCSQCQGSGRITKKQGKSQVMTVCPSCGGSGRMGQPRPCPACGGRGQTSRRETIKAKIPAGVDTGSKVRLAGKGNPGANGGPPGDLFLEIEVAPDPTFSRSGQDLNVTVDVPLVDAVLGGKVEVPTLTGRANLTIPAGTQNGAKLRLKGQGVPASKSKSAGNLYVTVKVVIPKNLSDEAKKKFEELKPLIS